MNKTEILNIVNEPSKHIQIVKIDGKDSIVYSSKFVELLELIPTMLTKADVVAMLEEIDLQFDEICFCRKAEWKTVPEIKAEYKAVIQQKINKLGGF